MGKKPLIGLVFLASALWPLTSRAQNITTVTATITDPNGYPYSNATIQAQLVPTGVTPTINGQMVSGFTQAAADVTGAFSMNLASNAVLLPGGTQWQFTVNEQPGIPPPAGTGPQSFSIAITIGGASQNISATLSSAAPALSSVVSPNVLAANNTWTGTNNFTKNAVFAGRSPYYDVEAYGARSLSTGALVSGATCSALSPTVTGVSTSFKNLDGISIWQCGVTPTLATPTAPTITSGNLESPMGPGAVVRSRTGSNTDSYLLVARDKYGALSAAGPATTITTAITPGIASQAVTSESLVGNTLTVVVADGTVFGTGDIVDIQGSTNAALSGFYPVGSVSTNTLTINVAPLTSLLTAGTTSTGGTIWYYSANKLTWSTSTGAWEYYICGERPGDGSYSVLGVAPPNTASGFGLTWNDYGATITTQPSLPGYVTNSICTAAVQTNDPLTTTIVSGGGTSTIVAANAATNSAASTTAMLDAAPGIVAAATAMCSNLGGGYVYIPPSLNTTGANTYFPISSFLDLTTIPGCLGKYSVMQEGNLLTNEMIVLPKKWSGIQSGKDQAFSSWGPTAFIQNNSAYPQVMIPSGSGGYSFDHVDLNTAKNQDLNMFVDTSATDFYGSIDHDGFSNSSSTDYSGMGLIVAAGASENITNDAFYTNIGGNNGHRTLAPIAQISGYPGSVSINSTQRGLYVGTATGNITSYVQACDTPALITGYPGNGSSSSGSFAGICDSSPVQAVVMIGTPPPFGTVYGITASETGGQPPVLSGIRMPNYVGTTVTDSTYPNSPFPTRIASGPNTTLVYTNAFTKIACNGGLSGGASAIAAGAVPAQVDCYNTYGDTEAILSIGCFTDNNGTTTLTVTNGAGTTVTGPITCTNAAGGALGSLAAVTSLPPGDVLKFAFTSDGTPKQMRYIATLGQ